MKVSREAIEKIRHGESQSLEITHLLAAFDQRERALSKMYDSLPVVKWAYPQLAKQVVELLRGSKFDKGR